MTNDQIKQLVATGDFCIQCPADYDTNEKWKEFAEYNTRAIPTIGNYYTRQRPEIGGLLQVSTLNYQVITLDQWWDAVHGEERIYTIQDLADGKVACVNDGTVEELREVLKNAFRDDPSYGRNDYLYYKFYFSAYYGMGKFQFDSSTNLPTQSVKDFVKQLEQPVKEEPQQWQPQPGEMVEVSDNGREWGLANYYAMCGQFYAAKDDSESVPTVWAYCRPVQYHTVTIEELKDLYAKVHSVDRELVKILES